MYIPDPSLCGWVWGWGWVGVCVGVGVSWCVHRYYTSWSIYGVSVLVCVSVYHAPSSVDRLLDVGRGCAYCLTGYTTTCGS